MKNLEFMKVFNPEELCIKEFRYWIVCIRKKQVTLGDAIIALKREIPNMSDMTKEEAAEFAEVTKWYENTCKEKFGAVKFNYIAMMMKDLFVHYHAFPRYNKKVNLFDIEWEERNPLNYFGTVEETEDKILYKIIEYMK